MSHVCHQRFVATWVRDVSIPFTVNILVLLCVITALAYCMVGRRVGRGEVGGAPLIMSEGPASHYWQRHIHVQSLHEYC